MADQPARYASPPESVELARETMRDIRAALTKDALGHFPASHTAMDWDGLNMQPHDTAWQDMDLGQRYDLLRHVLDESIWSLESGDTQKLALDFVREDARQAMPGFRADAFDALTTRLDAFADEFARLARTDGQTALAQTFQTFVGEAQWTIARLAEVRPPANPAAFDRVVADLRRHWHEDGHGDGGETWEEQSAVEKIGYLAGHAAAHNVSFECFVEAAARTLGLASAEEFTPVEVQHLLHQIRWAHGDYSDDPAGMSPHSAPKDRLAIIAATPDEHDGMPTPEEWRKLQAEWTHDYGLRRLEERGVSYEDEAERSLDHATAGMTSPADLIERAGTPPPKLTDRHIPRHKL